MGLTRSKTALVLLCWLGAAAPAAAQGFPVGDVLVSEPGQPEGVQAGDVDGDGDADLVVGQGRRVAWFENQDGLGLFGSERTIGDLDKSVAWRLVDVDLDLDLDVVVGASPTPTASRLVWFENTDAKGAFGPERLITADVPGVQAVFAADLDGDGDPDVLTASAIDDTIAWHENQDGAGDFGPRQPISTQAGFATSVFAADLDGDGDADVISTAAADDTLAWYENTDGLGTFGAPRTISASLGGAADAVASDLDGDGDLDVLASGSSSAQVVWFANDGAGSFGPELVVTTSAWWVDEVHAADLDGDGDPDVLAAAQGVEYYGYGYVFARLLWFENTGGAFGTPHAMPLLGLSGLSSADVDGDGVEDLLIAAKSGGYDALTKHVQKIAWAPFQGAAFGPLHVVTPLVERPSGVAAADLDGDGDVDLAYAADNDDLVAWHPQLAGSQGFGLQRVVDSAADRAAGIAAGDVDGDGDLDLVAPLRDLDAVVWYENADGLGGFASPATVAGSLDDVSEADLVDLDQDGDLDVLFADTSGVGWIPGAGAGGFAAPAPIAGGSHSEVHAADVDGDGQVDVLGASRSDDRFVWYRNQGGAASFAPAVVIQGGVDAAFVRSGDVDQDGDLDALTAAREEQTYAWHANQGGAGAAWTEHVISVAPLPTAAIASADLDLDGTLDALASTDHALEWFPNVGGGVFPAGFPIDDDVGLSLLEPADVDGDGRTDVVAGGSVLAWVAWYENQVCGPPIAALETVRLGTPPNPAALQPGVTSGPVAGQVWDPWIDHASFQPLALYDFLAISATSSNLPTPAGTILCGPNPPIVLGAEPGAGFSVSVPVACAFPGASLCAQGASLSATFALKLTNALDLVVGSY